MECLMILKDNTELTFRINGSTLISDHEIEGKLLTEENLSSIKIKVENRPEILYKDIILVQQVLYKREWQLSFKQKTEEEKSFEEIKNLRNENSELINRCLEIEMGLMELAKMQGGTK